MKLELLTLCDFAKGEPTGKLYVIGAFDHIFAPQTPVQAPLCAIAARLRFDAVETGTKAVTIAFVDSDGGRVIPDVNMQMRVELPASESSAAANLVVVLPQVNLPRFGEYSIDLTVDARLEGSVPLFVQRPAAPPPATRSFPAQA
jgi:hypothetical protein